MRIRRHAGAGPLTLPMAFAAIAAGACAPGALGPSTEEVGYVVLDYGPEGNAAAGQAAASFDPAATGCAPPSEPVAGTVVKHSFNSWAQDSQGRPIPNATALAADLERLEAGEKLATMGADQLFSSYTGNETFKPQPNDAGGAPSGDPSVADDGQIDLSTGAQSSEPPPPEFLLAGDQSVHVNCGYETINGQRYYVANMTTPVTQHSAIYVNEMAAHLNADLIIGRGEDAGINDAIARGADPYVRIEDGVYNRQYRMLPGFNNDGSPEKKFTPLPGSPAVDQFDPNHVFRSEKTDLLADLENVEAAANGKRFTIKPGTKPIENNTYACGNLLAQLLASRQGKVTTADGSVQFQKLREDTGIYFLHGPAHDPTAPADQQLANAQAWRNTTNQAIHNYFSRRSGN